MLSLPYAAAARPALCDGVSRRDFLRLGSLGLGGISLAQLLETEARAGTRNARKAVIMIYLVGGPPHQDMFDLKPNAPAEIAGPHRPIATNVSGIDICELFPQMAARMDKLAALSPANPEGWFGVAQMALMAHQAAEARDAARRAEALYVAAGSPLVDDARLLLGFAAIALADWPTVRATLEPQYAKLASDAEVNLALGKAYLEPDALDRAKARQYLQRARDLGATVTDALWQRAR